MIMALERELPDFRTNAACVHPQTPHSYRKLEPPRSRAAGIEIENSIPGLLFRNVTVSTHYSRESGGLRLKVHLRQIVQHVDRNPANFKHLGFRQLTSPRLFIDIAAHRGHGRDRSKLFKNLRRSNIPGMNNCDPRSASIASGRSRPCVSEMTPITMLVIPSKRFWRSEGSGRAARSVAFFATQ